MIIINRDVLIGDLVAVFAVFEDHLRHEVAVVAAGQRLGPPANDHFGGFEPREGVPVQDDGDVLIADLLRVQVSAERIPRRLALRLVLVQLEIPLLLLVTDDLLFRRLRLDQLKGLFAIHALFDAELDQRQDFCNGGKSHKRIDYQHVT